MQKFRLQRLKAILPKDVPMLRSPSLYMRAPRVKIQKLSFLVGKFLRLDPRDRRLFLSALFLLAVVRIGLSVLPFKNLTKILGKLSRVVRYQHSCPPSLPDRIAWAIEKASAYVPAAKCLCRGLVGQVLLSWHGVSSDLHIGIFKRSESELEAHAWVETDGRVLIGDLEDLSRYVLLPSLPKI